MADQLPGSGTDPLTGQPAKAGLFIPAKSERHAYSKPGTGSGTSVLGLDKLAAAKVAERGAMPPPGVRPAAKRPREQRSRGALTAQNGATHRDPRSGTHTAAHALQVQQGSTDEAVRSKARQPAGRGGVDVVEGGVHRCGA